MGVTASWLVFDEIGTSFTSFGPPTTPSMIAIQLTRTPAFAGTTEWLPYHEVTADRIRSVSRSGGWSEDWPCSRAEPVGTCLPFDRREAARRLPFADADRAAVQVPAFLVTDEETETGTRSHVYCCSRIRESGMLFSRIWSGPTAPDGSPAPSILTACREQPGLLRRCTDEHVQTMRFHDDVEIELKLTLEEPDSPWRIACELAKAVQHRKLSGYIPDLGNELQRWTYEQDTFEILEPEDKMGYVAFMSDSDGSHVVKYKFFTHDSLRRVERFDDGVRVEPHSFEEYIRTQLGDVSMRRLPHMTRTRFDVNVESARTGHFFGLEMDEVRAGGRVMQQLEVEYHKTRACHGVREDTVEPELSRLADQVQSLLKAEGVMTRSGYFSKLSFLRQVAVAG
ncbi:hypothetical protein ACU635_61030 [[Actinomadura] parvosata]|uniref:hypothetical protein n=1 Tax=[Actinomadura] parvosata TaxID=1955412 RepID=UPI00406D4CAD